MTPRPLKEQVEEAMWADDRERLQDIAPCGCCCREHTYAACPARLWRGCRSGLAPGAVRWEEELLHQGEA